ncbi:MAG: hypothetical protein ACKVH8_07425 [Pirellulales bacterium]
MRESTPHFLLYCESISQFDRGTWRFSLECLGTDLKICASGEELSYLGDRLALLGVVRGLEALPEPGRITLLTGSRYVSRGFRYGLPVWRDSNWNWERFGKRVPVKNDDLWRRIDHAMSFHTIDCRPWKFENQPSSEDGNVNHEPNQQSQPATHAIGKKPTLLRILKNRISRYGEAVDGIRRILGNSAPKTLAG